MAYLQTHCLIRIDPKSYTLNPGLQGYIIYRVSEDPDLVFRVIAPLKYREYGFGYDKIPIYPIFYLLEGGYNPKPKTLYSIYLRGTIIKP